MTVKQFLEQYKNDHDILDLFYEKSGKYAEVYGDKADEIAIKEIVDKIIKNYLHYVRNYGMVIER